MRTTDEAQFREAVRAMESGDKKAKTKVAFYKLSGRGGCEVDVDGAVLLLEERANEDKEAQWMLGLCCEFGMGIEQDIERAELLYRQSSESGNETGWFLSENKCVRGSGRMMIWSLWNDRHLLR